MYPKALFGSELEHRVEYERTTIPGIVMRCIQEVDARGQCVCYRLERLSDLTLFPRHGYRRHLPQIWW